MASGFLASASEGAPAWLGGSCAHGRAFVSEGPRGEAGPSALPVPSAEPPPPPPPPSHPRLRLAVVVGAAPAVLALALALAAAPARAPPAEGARKPRKPAAVPAAMAVPCSSGLKSTDAPSHVVMPVMKHSLSALLLAPTTSDMMAGNTVSTSVPNTSWCTASNVLSRQCRK